jgi:cysteine desulfurase/selenocysteine lyase
MAFDVQAVRSEFPILLREVHNRPLVYLDSAASAQKPRAVIDAMAQSMEWSYANVLGTINPVAEIVAMAQAAGAITLVDGCQGIVHEKVDVRALGADFYVFSGHKLYGPTGIGVLYGKAERLAALRPYQGGGEMIGHVTEEAITYADPPHRFEAGTPPIIEVIGLGAAIDWLSGLDRSAIAAHEAALYARVREKLAGSNGIREIGQAPGKGAIFAFNLEGAHAHDVAQILDRYGVAVRAGTHCAEPLMRRFGLTASARASFALYNTLEEADSFVDALNKTQAFFA